MQQHLQNAICRYKQKQGEQKACIGISVSLKPDINCKKQSIYCGKAAETDEDQFTNLHDKPFCNYRLNKFILNKKNLKMPFRDKKTAMNTGLCIAPFN